MRKYYLILITLFLVITYSCEKDASVQESAQVQNSTFDYNTTKEVDLTFSITNALTDIENKAISVFNSTTGERVYKGLLDGSGKLETTITVPTYLNELTIINSIPGLGNVLKVCINNDKAIYSNDLTKSTTINLKYANEEECTTEAGTYKTLTMGAWGNANEHNAASDIYEYFEEVFDDGLTIGCLHTISFTSAQAIVDFLPVGGTPVQLTQSYIDPSGNDLESISVFAGQLIAVTLAVEFNNYGVPGYATTTTPLRDLVITEGTYKGWTVTELLAEANLILGNCSPARYAGQESELSDALSRINENFDEGNRDLGFLECPGAEPDCDNDGIPDGIDEYPCDPNKTFNNISEGTLVYEDLWPNKGDYDFNDVVIAYTYNLITNTAGLATFLEVSFTVKATGASYHNGFGFVLYNYDNPTTSIRRSDIASVSGDGYLESGQSKAVFIAFYDAYNLFPSGDYPDFINTIQSAGYISPSTTSFEIAFNSPVDPDALGSVPFNPFIIRDGNRSVEIHLQDHKNTDLANTTLFGLGDDASDPSQGMYYVTNDFSAPWAINIPDANFKYPIERIDITEGYLKFQAWAESDGTSYTDWYTNTSSDFRDESKLY